jgi:hypothetical protein
MTVVYQVKKLLTSVKLESSAIVFIRPVTRPCSEPDKHCLHPHTQFP